MSNGIYRRTPSHSNYVTDGGPYEAIVVSHLDKRYMGGLEVELLRYTGAGNSPERSGQLLTVRYLSPFYGVTPNKGLTPADGYHHTQKSYGMWMVPPDVGTKVLVVFAEGNANFGYWIGCIPDDYMNFMVPDGRASTSVTTNATPEHLVGSKLPVGEYNKARETGEVIDPTLFSKPYNKDFTNVLEIQGLLFDEIRGTTTTSARRELPSMVFGFNTPGPADKRQNAPRVDAGARNEKARIPYSRLGGSSFVMDDGDDKFVRATHAEDGPPIYLNRERGESGGDETIPQNELVRIRTRTGHQILLHNSEDLIYIGNSRGTAWIEITSDGKIDIHAQDSISVMSDNDINFTAERDFNVEAGRNVNIKAAARWSDEQQYFDNKESGRIQIESKFNTNIHVGRNYNLTVENSSNTQVDNVMRTTVESDYHLHTNANLYQRSESATHESSGRSWFRESDASIHDTAADDQYIRVGANLNVYVDSNFNTSVNGSMSQQVNDSLTSNIGSEVSLNVGSDIKTKSGGTVSLDAADSIHTNSAASIFSSASSDVNITAGSSIVGDAPDVSWNSGLSTAASPSSPSSTTAAKVATPAVDPGDANRVEPLSTIVLPYIFPGAIKPTPYDSILTRAPQHEPWGHHENTNPQAFKKEQTDREDPGMLPVSDRIVTPDTFLKNTTSEISSRVVLASGGSTDFMGTTGDGLVNQTEQIDYQFDPAGDEGALAEIRTRTGKTAMVAEVFAKNFQDFIDDLEATGYEIRRITGYSRRRVASGSGAWSVHASGGAIDINWPDQVHGGYPNGYFSPRPRNAPMTDMPANTLELANKHGLGWGGAWRTADDAMHFSAHKAEGGAFEFPRNGKIPKGPSNEDVNPAKPEQGTDLSEPEFDESQEGPGPQDSELDDLAPEDNE